MFAPVAAVQLELDPLIAEAKRRVRRRPGSRRPIAPSVRVPFCGPHYFWELPIGRSP